MTEQAQAARDLHALCMERLHSFTYSGPNICRVRGPLWNGNIVSFISYEEAEHVARLVVRGLAMWKHDDVHEVPA